MIGVWLKLNNDILEMCIENDYDVYGNVKMQTLTDEAENEYYYVYNMDNTPEDATISRNLFSAEDYIATLRLGMRLANEGYEGIDFTYKEDDR